MDVKCTQCGGSVPVKTDQDVARCQYCGSSLYISLHGGFVHQLIRPTLQDKDLANILQTELQRRERKGHFEIRKATRVFWPYWQIQEGDVIQTFIGATNPITSLENAGIPSGDARPFSTDETSEDWVEPPTETMEDLVEREGIMPTKVWLAHLPFWIVHYEYDGVTFETWVDAVGGKVYADELPPTFAKEKDRQYALAAFLMFCIFFIIGVLAPDIKFAVLLYGVVSIPLYFGVKQFLKGVMS